MGLQAQNFTRTARKQLLPTSKNSLIFKPPTLQEKWEMDIGSPNYVNIQTGVRLTKLCHFYV